MTPDDDLVRAALPLYEVHGELGRGAWGVVVAGRHRQLGRDVAIKQLPRALGQDAAVRSRFVAEARLLASLDHTHIVPIYDFVEHEGLCLLVMERLTGGTVWSRFQAGALTPERSCALTLATSSALHYAHAHGVLHRDVKPENLLFSTQGVLKVTDFGIAKVVGGSSTVATRAGDVLGTPAYMAPEQAQGQALGAPADIYALGTVLYELLAGRLPFPTDDNPLTTLYRHVNDRPQPLSEVAPHVPPAISEVTDRALATDPDDRYADAEAFGVALAEAASEAWGTGWLGESGVTVAAPGPILSAAVGRPSGRASATIVEGAPTATSPAPSGVTPGDLVPVNLLRPEAVGAAPLVDAPERHDTAPPDAPPSGPPRMPAGAPAPPPPFAGRPWAGDDGPGAPRRRRIPRWALAGGGAAVVIALVAAVLVVRSGSDDDDPSATRRQSPSSATGAPVEAGAWRTLRDTPTARQQVATAVLDGTVWVLGGLAGDGSTATVEGYDPAIDTWKTGPDLPIPVHHAVAASYEGELVVIGGWVPDGPNLTATTSDRVFALRDGDWVDLPPLRTPRAAGAAAVVGDQLVVFGGQSSGELVETVEVFDGARWTETAALPTPREHLAGASDGQFVYAVGGRNLSSDKNLGAFERFDPATGRWNPLPDLPTPRGGLGAAVTDGRLITVGGESPTEVFDTVEIYDIAASAWSAGPAMLTPRHGMAIDVLGSTLYAVDGARQPSHTDSSAIVEALDFSAAESTTTSVAPAGPAWRKLRNTPTARQQVATAALDGTLWVLGGLAGDASTAKVEGYDPAIDTWKVGPDLPLPLHHAMAANYAGELVVLGGWVPDGRNLTATTSDRVFALRGGSWVELPSLPTPRAAGAAGVVGDQLVVFGGQSGGQLVDTVEVFDGERWTETAALPTPREHLAGASDGQFVYAVGGRNLSSDKNLGAFERYDPAARRWTALPDLPTPRGGLGATVVEGRLVAAGGEGPTQLFDTVEIFDLAAGAWAPGPAMTTPRHGMAFGVLGSTVYAIDGARRPSHTDSSAVAEALDL